MIVRPSAVNSQTLAIAIHHVKEGKRVPETSTEALEAFEQGDYRLAGVLSFSFGACAPDKALHLAWRCSQNVAGPWREGERSTMPGDVFAIGKSLYRVTRTGFTVLVHRREPRIVQAQRVNNSCARVTFDNGEMAKLFPFCDEGYLSADELLGLTTREVRRLYCGSYKVQPGFYHPSTDRS